MNDLSTEGERTMTKYRVPLQTTAYAYAEGIRRETRGLIEAVRRLAREEAGEQ